MRQLRSPSRWTWVLPVMATAFIVACDTALQAINQDFTWGFVTVSAQKSATGAHFANAEGLFFSGNLSAVPNADLTLADTCGDGVLSEGNNLIGVTYLDAGLNVPATIGGVTTTLDRVTTATGIAYRAASPPAFTPGDSIVLNTTGVPGGFPAGSIRAKTAEAFSLFPAEIPVPAGTEDIQLTWTAPLAPRSAMVVSLRYATATTPTVLSRHVFCNFIDDGEGSIPFRWYQTWSVSSMRSVVATRLRTNYVAAGDANLGVISTYQVPTPPRP